MACLVLVVLLLASRGVQAAEDGGVRSVFDFGAGNRALAMGGAYTALADDASAPAWNAGGLAFIQRREVQASSARLYGLDVSEQYVSFVVPSWRWGTTAFSFRRLGVGGIDQRDERNVQVDTGLGAEDTEFLFAYGRAFRRGVGVGTAVKLRRQALGGLADSGLGLDLGLLVRPAALLDTDHTLLRRMRLGLSLENLFAPTVRLDRDAVDDPVGMRVGAAYQHPLLRSGGLLLAVDVDKTRGGAAQMHFGVELSIHPAVALRTGWSGSNLAAGAGVRWREVSLDFVIDANEIEIVHRIGVGMQFGASTEESRQAAMRSEEELFRARMEQSFQSRERRRVTTILTDAEELLAAGQYDAALRVVAAVVAVDPENAWGRSIEMAAVHGQAQALEQAEEFTQAAVLYRRVLALDADDAAARSGIERCRDESDRRAQRSVSIRRMFARALDAFAAGELVAARDELERVLAIESSDADALAMLDRTRAAIGARVAEALAQAGYSIQRGRLDAAAALLADARQLDAGADGLATLDRRLASARQQAAAAELDARRAPLVVPPAVVPSGQGAVTPVLTREQRQEMTVLYRRGLDAMEGGHAEDAVRYLELVWNQDPTFQDVADYLKRHYLLYGLERFSQGDLEHAADLWERALEIAPDDLRAQGYLERAREQLARTHELLGP